MRIQMIFSVLLAFVFQFTNAQGYTLKGEVVGLKDSTMVLLRNVERSLPFDTTYVVNGKFQFKGKIRDCSEMFFIRTTPYNKYLTKRFHLENTTMEVVLNEQESNIRISGGLLQNQSNAYEDFLENLSAGENFRGKLNSSMEYIKKHDDEEFTAYLLHDRRMNLTKEQIQELYNSLSLKIKNSKHGKILANHIQKVVDFKPGTSIVDFTLKDTNGNNVSLSSFKGKYVLLDFWGSWCGSCRSKYPEYSRIYEKYKDKGFEIVGVSLDTDEGKWKRAIKKDKTEWVNLIDPTGFTGDVAVTYNVWAVPIAYFIDAEGKIIEPITFSPFTEEKLVKALESE